MNNKKKTIGILAGVLVLSAAIFLPIFAAFAADVPVRNIGFSSTEANYENGDPGAWHIEKEAYWTKKGIAKMNIELTGNTPARSDKHYDLVLLIDESGSMFDGELDEAKADMITFANGLLSDGQSRIALVGFATTSHIVTDFTTDSSRIAGGINSLNANGQTDYYYGYQRVNQLLENYEPVEGNELCVMLVSDGYPNNHHPEEIAEYKLLKENYPDSLVYGIRYGNGGGYMNAVTDKMENSDKATFLDTMVSLTKIYESFNPMIITDYINDKYFELTGKYSGDGLWNVTLADDGTPMVIWDLSKSYFNGTAPRNLSIELKLKDEYLNDEDGLFPTSKKTRGVSSVKNMGSVINEDTTTLLSPILKLKYWVHYEANAPSDCTIEGTLPQSKEEVVFSTVRIASNQLSCGDWSFKGWQIRTSTAERINKDYFIMGNEDIYIEGTWGRPAITKSTEGTPWQESYALLDTGPNVNRKLRALATDNVLAVKKADELLEDRITSTNNKISAASSPVNIYAWFNTSDKTIYIYSDAETIKGNSDSSGMFNGLDTRRLRTVVDFSGLADWDMTGVRSLDAFMAYITGAANIDALASWDVSHVTDIDSFFSHTGISDFSAIADWDVSNVETARNLFSENTAMVNADALAGWRFDNLKDATGMFYKMTNLVSISGVRNWNPGKLENMSQFITWSKKVASLDGLQDWDVSHVTTIYNAFQLMDSLVDISALEKWDTSNMTSMYGLFYSDSKLADFSALRRRTITREDGTSYVTWDVSNATSFESFFMGTKFSDSAILSDWDVSSATSMYRMFYNSTLINTDGLADWDVSHVTNMTQMFSGVNGLTSLAGLSKWNMSNVQTMSGMFSGGFVTGKIVDLTGLEYKLVEEEGKEPYYAWDLSNVTAIDNLFYSQESLQNVDAMLDWKIPKVRSMEAMFSECTSLTDLSGLRKLDVGQVTSMKTLFAKTTALRDLTPLQNWDTKNVNDMTSLFSSSGVLDLTPIRGWNVGKLTNIYNAFSYTSLATLDGLQDWKPCAVTNLKETFRGTKQLTSISQLAGWAKKADDSVCIKPVNMIGTFYDSGITSTHGLEDWDIRSVTDFVQTFQNAKSLTDLTGLSGTYWNQPKTAVASYQGMFVGATALVSLNGIGGWPMNNTKNVREMFDGATNLEDIDALGTWQPTVINDMIRMFRNDAKLTTEDLAVLENWNATLTTTPRITGTFDGIPADVVRPTIGPANGG